LNAAKIAIRNYEDKGFLFLILDNLNKVLNGPIDDFNKLDIINEISRTLS